MGKSSKSKNKHTSELFSLIFLLTFIASCPLSWRLADASYLENVEGKNPEWFSALIVTPDNAEVIHVREIDSFAKTNPSYSFLVPEDKQAFYQDKLVSSFRQKRIDASPKFEVRRISADRQAIRLSIEGDGATVTEYEALDKRIFPKTSKIYDSGFIIVPALYSFIVALVIAIIARLTWQGYKLRNRRTAI